MRIHTRGQVVVPDGVEGLDVLVCSPQYMPSRCQRAHVGVRLTTDLVQVGGYLRCWTLHHVPQLEAHR